MSTSEDRIRHELHRAVLASPKALEAMATGDTVEGDTGVLIRDVMLPLILAQGDALVELARTVDELRNRVTELEGETDPVSGA